MQAEKRKQEKAKEEKEKKKKKKKKKAAVEEEKAGEDVEGWGKGGEDEDEDIIDDEDDEKGLKEDQDVMIGNKNPEFKRCVKILEELKKKYPQFNLNGEKNIWIIKPAGSSRGRGIVLYKQLVEILDLCKQKESQFIA